MKFAIIVIIFMFSVLGRAVPTIPYIDTEDGRVVIEDTKETKVYLSDCSYDKTAVKYFGQSPICTQGLTCRRGEVSKVAIVEPSDIKISVYCAISSASAGCKSKSWKDCIMDKTYPNELNINCASDSPGSTKPGCPNVDSMGPSKKSETGVR